MWAGSKGMAVTASSARKARTSPSTRRSAAAVSAICGGSRSAPTSEISSWARASQASRESRGGTRLRAGRLLVEALEDLVGDGAAGQRFLLGPDPLRVELVPDEPAIGAECVFLEGGGAEELDLPHPLEHRLELQRPRSQPAVLGSRADRRLGPGELALARRRAGAEDRLRQSPAARLSGDRLVALLEVLRQRGREQLAYLVDERRPRGRAALVVGVPPGEPEALLRPREADREEVAVLDLRLLSLRQAEGAASVVGEQRPARVAAREVAVLHRADEDVGDPAGAGAVGTDHADASLGGPAPHRHVEFGDGGHDVPRGVGQAELGELGERLLDLGSGPQLERPVLLGHGALTAHGRLGDPAGLLAGLAEQRGSGARLPKLRRPRAAPDRRSRPRAARPRAPRRSSAAGRAAPSARTSRPSMARRRRACAGRRAGPRRRRRRPRPEAARSGPRRWRSAWRPGRPARRPGCRSAGGRGGRGARPSAGRGARSRSPRQGLRRRGGARPRRPRPRPRRAPPRRRAGRPRRRSRSAPRASRLAEAALDLEQGRALREARLGLQALDRRLRRSPEARRRGLRVPRSATRGPPRAARPSRRCSPRARGPARAARRSGRRSRRGRRGALPRRRVARGARRSRRRRGSGRRAGRARREARGRTRRAPRSPARMARPPTHAPEVRPDRRARPAAPRRARRARPGTRVSATTSRGFPARPARAVSRASRRRWVLLTAGPAGASVARATSANSWSKVPTVAPITTSPSRVSSSSKRSTSSTVGTTSTGSRPAAVLNASSVFPVRPELGGPTISFTLMRPSIGRDSARTNRARTAWFCA